MSDSMCFKIVETAAAFATAETGCSGLAEDAKMAAPKSAAIMTTLNALNPSREDFWVGLDDRYNVLFLFWSLDLHKAFISGILKELINFLMAPLSRKLEAPWTVTM